MALLGDIVAALTHRFGAEGGGFKWFGDKLISDLKEVGDSFSSIGKTIITEDKDLGVRDFIGDVDAFFNLTSLALTDPKEFVAEIFGKWDELLRRALAQLNVEPPEGPQRPIGEISLDLEAQLALGRDQAQKRVSAALAAINLILLTGNTISVAAEIASVGTVRSIAEAIQSWVWANGLGSFSPLAFQPQVNASISPYLNRWYNSRAQAQIPPVTDIIRFQLREMYLEGRREELVGTEERPVYNQLMKEWGFNEFHADSYWGAHWTLPSISQLNEMLFRGIIDRAEWERFVRFNDLEPLSIPRLGEIIYNPFTRVDVRRMSRMGILNDDELLQAYADLGNFAPTALDADGRFRAQFVSSPDFTIHKAQALVIFTKIFNALPELRQRFAKGWIGGDEVLDAIRATGIPELRARALFETIVKEEGPARTAPERELTRALIARAWKLRIISFDQALFLMQRLGWSFAEAELILRVQSQPDDPLAFVATNIGARLGAPVFGQFEGADDEEGM